MFDWNDVRYFLAVARNGSTLSASKKMRVSQATVSRRVTVLEEALGFTLFVRSPAGYELSPRGREMLASAETIEEAVLGFESRVSAEARRLSGTVRITTVEAAANMWVTPAIAAFRRLHPEVGVEIVLSDESLDLVHGEADVAIRFGAKPTEETLVVKHLIDLEGSVYASRDLVEELGMPQTHAELARYPLVAIIADFAGRTQQWYAEHAPGAKVVSRANTMLGILSGLRSGMGAGMLPCVMGDATRGLVRLFPPIDAFMTPSWMVTTENARQQAHIRATIDHLVEYVLSPMGQPMVRAVASAA